MAATDSAAFTRARDFLLAHRTNYDTAYRDFRWPQLTEFNWALDHFDPLARGNDATALHIVEEDGRETRRSFASLSARSDQVANWLRAQGVKRGDRVRLETPGGGGRGDPARRDPALTERDRRLGFAE